MKLDIKPFVAMGISADSINEFIEHRRVLKKPLTQKALQLNLKQAMKCHDFLVTPEQAIDYTIYKGWQGINSRWIHSNLDEVKTLNDEHHTVIEVGQSTRQRSLETDLLDRSWADATPLRDRKLLE